MPLNGYNGSTADHPPFPQSEITSISPSPLALGMDVTDQTGYFSAR